VANGAAVRGTDAAATNGASDLVPWGSHGISALVALVDVDNRSGIYMDI